MKKKVLLIGSGLSAEQVVQDNWNLDGWTVCCIHNAWRIVPDRWDFLLHAEDFPEKNKPLNIHRGQKMVTTLQWVRDSFASDKHGGFWRNHCGYGKTMFFTSFWWVMEHLKPQVFGFIGCDMHYPDGDKNCIYGKGNPDPLQYPLQSLLHWLGFIDGFCVRDNVMLINYALYGTPTLLPFSNGIFPSEKPIERAREHRTESEYYRNQLSLPSNHERWPALN